MNRNSKYAPMSSYVYLISTRNAFGSAIPLTYPYLSHVTPIPNSHSSTIERPSKKLWKCDKWCANMSSTHSSGVFLTSSIGSVFFAGFGTPDINKHPNDTNGGFLFFWALMILPWKHTQTFKMPTHMSKHYDSRCSWDLAKGYPISPRHHARCIYPSLPFLIPPCPSQNTSRSRNSPSKLRHSMMDTTSTTVVARQFSSKDTETWWPLSTHSRCTEIKWPQRWKSVGRGAPKTKETKTCTLNQL